MNGVSPSQRTTLGIVAIVLGFFGFGWLGIHKFMMGKTKPAVISILVSVLTCGIGAAVFTIISLVEGIVYLTKSDEQWYHDSIISGKDWF
jgi:TM2 domain-containing membrane protein YozV